MSAIRPYLTRCCGAPTSRPTLSQDSACCGGAMPLSALCTSARRMPPLLPSASGSCHLDAALAAIAPASGLMCIIVSTVISLGQGSFEIKGNTNCTKCMMARIQNRRFKHDGMCHDAVQDLVLQDKLVQPGHLRSGHVDAGRYFWVRSVSCPWIP